MSFVTVNPSHINRHVTHADTGSVSFRFSEEPCGFLSDEVVGFGDSPLIFFDNGGEVGMVLQGLLKQHECLSSLFRFDHIEIPIALSLILVLYRISCVVHDSPRGNYRQPIRVGGYSISPSGPFIHVEELLCILEEEVAPYVLFGSREHAYLRTKVYPLIRTSLCGVTIKLL